MQLGDNKLINTLESIRCNGLDHSVSGLWIDALDYWNVIVNEQRKKDCELNTLKHMQESKSNAWY